MKVLLISHTCQSRTEGQPKAACLASIPGVELRVVVPNRWKHYGKWRRAEPALTDGYKLNVAPVRFPWVGPAQNYLHYYPSLKSVLREFQPDVIDLWEEPWGAVSAHACMLRNRVLPQSKIITETEQNIDKHLPPPFEMFRRYVLQNANYAVGRNQDAIVVLRKNGYSGKAEVVPNGVDSDLFVPMNRSQCRAKLGVDGFVVGYVGRLVQEKGLVDLVDAIAVCSTDVKLVFVGSGPEESTLRACAESRRCADRVHILPARSLQQLPELMNAFDCLALPSRTTARWREQFGRVLIEAGSCGIPVIGSNSGAIPSTIGGAGLVFPEGNVREIVNAIQKLQHDLSLCRTLGETGRERAIEQFTWRRVAERMHAIYRRVLGDVPASAPRATASFF